MLRWLKTIIRYVVRTVLGVLLAIGIFVVVWPIWVFNREFRQCVALPNGLYLGYAAVFDLTVRPLPIPEGTIKFADGTPLVDMKLYSVFVSDTSAFSGTEAMPAEGGTRFAWTAETGLIHAEDDYETYSRIVDETVYWNYGVGADDFYIGDPPRVNPESDRGWPASLGPVILMRELAQLPEFEMRWCKTRLFRW